MKLRTETKLDGIPQNTVWFRHKPEYFSMGHNSTYNSDSEKFDFYTADNEIDKFSKYNHIAVCNGGPSVDGVHTAKLEVVYEIVGFLKKNGNWVDEKYIIAQQRFPNHLNLMDKCQNLLDLRVVQIIDEEVVFEWKNPRNWQTPKQPALINPNIKKKIRPFTSMKDIRSIPLLQLFDLVKDEIWKTHLIQNIGVYQLRNRKTNDSYVGSAYGLDGFYGRITDYKNTGHGNNKLLMEKHFTNPNFLADYDFTILESFTPNTCKNEIIRAEQEWKKIVGSNLNCN